MKRGFSQEWLKIVACVTMLADHVGVVFYPNLIWFRIVGRISFPIFCYLLVEGFTHTGSQKKYALRLLLGAAISEFSYDYLFYGGITFAHQSVMVTLCLGFVMLLCTHRNKILPFAICFLAAEQLCSDYGGWGIALIWVFSLAREKKIRCLIEIACMTLIFLLIPSRIILFGSVGIPMQLFGLLSLVPIYLYSGKKATGSKWIQWGFYLFYPLHLTILLAIIVITR